MKQQQLFSPLLRSPAYRIFFPFWITLKQTKFLMKGGNTMLDMIALILLIIGGINWGSIGVFQFDIVAWAFQGQTEIISRIIYTLVGLAGVWCISLLFRDNEITGRRK
jgi:uncharacterized membrane protein YuzA (DUF378 family)